MQKFVDSEGRIWVVRIDVSAIKRVRSLTGVNLLEVVEGELIERLTLDPVLLADVLYAVCKPQADEQSIPDEGFGVGLAGDVIAEASAALIEGMVQFFPEPRRRLLQKAAAKYQTFQARAMTAIETRLDSPELEQQMLQQLNRELQRGSSNNSFTGSPESSAPIQGH